MRWTSCVLALTLAACATPRSRNVVDEPHAYAISPVARLGRWDGTRFVEVTPGSLPPSTLRVLVHGWTPGWDRQPIRQDLQRGWELSRPTGEPFEPWMSDLARFFTLHDVHAVVVAYSWADESCTPRSLHEHRHVLAASSAYGHVLAEAIEAGLAGDFYDQNGRIQLIGHSYGARVAATAAADLERPPAQLTMFDAPDGLLAEISGAETDMQVMLHRLPIGWGAGRIFVDNYISMMGRRYAWRDGLGAIRDVALAPPFGQLQYRRRHLYPMRFYAGSPGHGYGYDWSPLTGRASAPEGGCYEQRVAGEQNLVLGCSGSP